MAKKQSITSPKSFYVLLVLSVIVTFGLLWSRDTLFGDFRSQASRFNTVDKPIKLASFYKPLNNLTTTQMAGQMHTIILTRNDEDEVVAVKQAGFSNPVLQYLRADAIQGPAYLENSSRPCTDTEKAFDPRSNQITNQVGEFCWLHDAIVNGTAIDHDLNPQTGTVVPSEDWFLHNAAGQRLGDYSGGGFYYHTNPGNVQYQEYFAARVLREMEGTENHLATGMDGIFLDNLELSWAKKARSLDVPGQPIEYTTSSEYVNAVEGLIAKIDQVLAPGNYPLWANMIENPRQGLDWNQFAPYLEGAMEESFALDWDGVPRPSSYLTKQFEQATSWIGQGKYYLAVAQGTDNQLEARYGLVAMLLITDSVHGVYRHADSSAYRDFWDYPEYQYELGRPVAPRERVTGTTDEVWQRQFTCGRVELNVTQGTSLIEAQPCPTASPEASPSPASSPSPVTEPSPSPAADTTAPSVSWAVPTDGAVVAPKSTVSLQAQASDDTGVAKVEFMVDGSVVCADTAASYSCDWKVPPKAGNTYTLVTKAYDAAGNSSQAQITVRAENSSTGDGGTGGGNPGKGSNKR